MQTITTEAHVGVIWYTFRCFYEGHDMYQIEFSPQAQSDLAWFKNQEQNIILDGIEQSLRYEPTVVTRNRKPLRLNTTATWELRIGKYRVFYEVTEVILIVSIEAIGLKIRDKLQFRGKDRTL